MDSFLTSSYYRIREILVDVFVRYIFKVLYCSCTSMGLCYLIHRQGGERPGGIY